ncbi:MAG: NAD-dependent succinate-semialdehyde dehydrogenase [Deltaproteobacteria bacterium]|nr:NAD-dependent succinate-semialdehyde dehydrogenase [Candidatus Zymogenaceae bacterium]
MDRPNLMYIDGQWVGASDGKTTDVIDPASEQVVDTVPVATGTDLDRALAAAEIGFAAWRETDAWTRSAIIRRVAELVRERTDRIAEMLTEEEGKPTAEAVGEIRAAADQFDWYADEARRIYGRVIDGHSREHRLLVIRQPIGPVAAFSPWNFPALLSSRKIAPALAAGCSVIVKPAVEAPRTTLCLAQACHDAGVPPGVVGMVTGSSSFISSYLISSPIIRKVTLTGSVPVGIDILRACADGIKAVSMELGGHSPVLVFPDADIQRAAQLCARAKYRNNGQVCIAASRFFVHESVAEQFTDHFVKVTRSLKVGDGRKADTDVGPLANVRRLETTERLVEDAVKKGASLVAGGHRADGFEHGYFFEPTVLVGVDGSMAVMTEEPFCPIAPIATFADLDEAVAKANATEFGLAGYIFTTDTKTAFLAAERLDVGMVGVNTLLLAAAEIPFGGVKKSGFGREGGTEWVESYTVTKHINIQL